MTKTPEELFGNLDSVKACGGRLDASAMLPTIASVIELYKASARKWIVDVRKLLPRMPEVYFDFTASGEVNAFATIADGQYVIAINGGAAILMLLFFRRMLADGGFLRQIGDPAKEADALSPWQGLYEADANKLVAQNLHSPADPVRRDYANLLAWFAFHFLVEHEHGHLAGGHVGYLQHIMGQPFIAETGFTNTLTLSWEISHAMEMDADCCANNQGMARVFSMSKNIERIGPEGWRQFFQDPLQAIKAWLIATYSLFRLFGLHRVDPLTLRASSHPLPNLRASWLLPTIGAYLKKYGPEELVVPVRKLLGEVMVEVETAFSRMTGLGIPRQELLDPYSPDAIAYTKEVIASLDNLRPNLSPFAKD